MLNLADKTPQEKANLKGQEIAKIKSLKKTKRGNLHIEILEINAISGGVEVLARAWKNGKQLGFGKDGSVDIERFRIFNPPILIDDPKGEIVREWTDAPTNERKERRLKYDAKEALLQSLEHTISIVGKDSGNIIKGKKGNTTSTFYANAGGDGRVERVVPGSNEPSTGGESWGTIRNGAGTYYDNSNASTPIRTYTLQTANTWYVLARLFFPFDTSDIPDDDDVISATFSAYLVSKSDTDGQYSSGFNIYASTQASNTALVASDFGKIGRTAFATAVSYASLTTSQYNSWTLNSTGLSAVSKTGYTKLSMQIVDDASNSLPTHAYKAGHNQNVIFYTSDQTGTTSDPKLVVEHGTTATGSSFLLNFM